MIYRIFSHSLNFYLSLSLSLYRYIEQKIIMVKTKENDGSTDSGEERERNDDTSKCPHVNKSIAVGKIKKLLKNSGLVRSCSECEKDKQILNCKDNDDNEDEYDQSLWMCLKCGVQLCGRSRNQHALKHYEVSR